MRINDRSRSGRAVDTKPQLIQYLLSEDGVVLNSKVLIASLMKRRESRDESSRWCRDIGNYRRTVIDHVAPKYRMRIGEVMVDADNADILSSGTLIRADNLPGSVSIIRPICRGKQRKKLLYARINRDGNALARSCVVASVRVSGRGQQTLVSQSIGYR